MPFANEDPQPIPGYRNYLVYCDESGQTGKVYYGFGSLWMPWERRGDLTGFVAELRERHRYKSEIKWNNIAGANEAFYRELIEGFFRRNWLMFHCFIGRKGYIKKSLHKGGYDEALRKHFALLIRSKIAFFSQGDRRKAYHIVVDKLPSSYEKADEAAHVIVNHQLKQRIGFTPIHNLVTRDSRDAVGIQVADVLLGAIVTDWNQEATASAKKGLRDWVAEHLGWRHLRADIRHWEWKFNIWYFHADGELKKREASSWTLNLKYPVPPYSPKKSRRQP
ncbi:MAG: DUF3800 domain-containing protein [Fimbriimonadaceae bacterium]